MLNINNIHGEIDKVCTLMIMSSGMNTRETLVNVPVARVTRQLWVDTRIRVETGKNHYKYLVDVQIVLTTTAKESTINKLYPAW
jgi:hypothetical protein